MQFTIIFFEQEERGTQKAEDGEETLCPEVPTRAEKGREEREAERRAEGGGEEHIKAQLTASDAQGEGRKGDGEEKGEERVERSCQAAVRAAAQTQGAQAVVEQGEGCAEEERDEEAFELGGDLDAHLSHRRGA